MRYNDEPSSSFPAPSVPSLPAGLAGGRRRPSGIDSSSTQQKSAYQDAGFGYSSSEMMRKEGSGGMGVVVRKDPGTLDMAVLGKEGYDAEACESLIDSQLVC